MPPLVTDINLSLDDRFLYVSCWGTGELRQYDVSRSVQPEAHGLGRSSAASCGAPAHPSASRTAALNGGPQMVEISRDGRRVYVTNSLYHAWDDAVLSGRHPRLDGQAGCRAEKAASASIREFFLEFDGLRPHQVHLEGGDASSDSYLLLVR